MISNHLLSANLNGPQLIAVALLMPLTAALLIPLFHRRPNLREAVTLVASGLLAWAVWSLVPIVSSGARPGLLLFDVVMGLQLAFEVEPFGLLFALVAGTLWIVNSLYSIGYMRGNKEPRQTSYYVCFAVALAATMGIAFAKNLFTLFVCYEVLTLSTYPLVTHKATPEAMRAGRIYLLLLLGTSMILLLPAIIATQALAGTLDFRPGGILSGRAGDGVIGLLLGLYVFGIGKAALMPLHAWLPNAMVAPTPVSALLHAVAVVKAGVFTIVKVVVYIFGLDTVATVGAQGWLIGIAAVTLLMASLIALAKDNLKARLAYSTISQLAYIVLGALVATKMSVIGAGLHIATHAAGKITLFFCAGAIYVAHRKTLVSELDGIGRVMPVTLFAFFIASLSIIGIPPLGGTWSKWLLARGALDAGQTLIVAVLMLSALLSVAYLMPIVARGAFRPLGPGATEERPAMKEAPFSCVLALSVTALLSVVLFFVAGDLENLLAPAIAGAPAPAGAEATGLEL